MTQKPEPIDEGAMILRARDAITKVDRHGARGITLLSIQEIEALVLMLVCMGVMPWHDADPRPAEAGDTSKGEG